MGHAGEINFVVIGVLFQLSSLVTESLRITLVQILLQRRNLKLNPITTLSYVAPCCCAFLMIPFALLELPRIARDPDVRFDPVVLLSSASAAFGTSLNAWTCDLVYKCVMGLNAMRCVQEYGAEELNPI
jgi:hypothetical protein